jgi:hypothetical protein
MGTIDLPKTPGTLQAEKPAVRYSSVHSDEEMLALVLNEETARLVYRISVILPKELLKRFEAKGGLKEQLHDAINRNFRDIIKRFWTYISVEKTRDGNGKEAGFSTCYHPRAIAELLRSSGGTGKFNSGEIEKPIAHVSSLENHTNTILRHSSGTGAPMYGDDAYTVLKCAFMDNVFKPRTVMDIQLVVNILDSALTGYRFYNYAAVKYLIKDIVCKRIFEGINREIDDSGEQLAGQTLAERITALCSEIDPADASIGEEIKKPAYIEQIRNLGFGMAVNSLVAMLDGAQMGCQFIEYHENRRELVLREYEDTDASGLPDERYRIRLRYLDKIRLSEARNEYDVQLSKFEKDVQQLWDLLEVIYRDSKSIFKVHDFEDLVKKNVSRVKVLLGNNAVEAYKGGDEFSHTTGGTEKDRARIRIARMHERIKNMYDSLKPNERRVMEDRLTWLEKEYARLDQIINPHQLQEGLLLKLDITSIKQKKTTVNSIAAVLDEFLYKATSDFRDAATLIE